MKKPLYIFAFLILLIVAFVAGNRFNQRGADPDTADTGARRILHYVDPMNPAHTTKEPGIAPCGMPMEPVYADDVEPGGSGAVGLSTPLGVVRVSQQKQQIIGVRTGEVTKSVETYTIRALGRIIADENRIYTLIAATDGWMGEVHASTTGSLVDKNQLMAHIKILDYDFFTWQRRYLTESSYIGRRRAFLPPPPGAGLKGEEMPVGRQVGSSRTETGAPAVMPSAATPFETAASQISPEVGSPAHAAEPSPATAPTPALSGDMPPMGTPHSSLGAGEVPASATPDLMPPADDALAGPQHHSDNAPVLMNKRSTFPAAAGRKSARVVAGGSDGGLGLSGEDDSIYANRGRLELLKLGVGEIQLAELAESGAFITSVELRSPVSGLVLSRNISPRQKIDRGTECFKIADLSTVWVEADVYDSEVKYLRPGMSARISMPNQKEHFSARVSEVLPRFDAAARTLKVRLEMDNPGNIFRPDMFVDVEFVAASPSSTTVPSSAVVDTGKSRTVYVVIEEGVFEPRQVVTGRRWGDRVEIVEGLKPGEKIVLSGNFLIDSESRMKLAAAGLMEEKTEEPPDEQVPVEQAAPESKATQPVPQQAAAAEKVKDPICGMSVDPDNARAAGLFAEVGGQTYYFCSAECKEEFHLHGPPPAVSAADSGTAAPSDHGVSAADTQHAMPPAASTAPGPPQAPVKQPPADAPGDEGHDHD